jgi:hypothetical protein
MPAPFRVPLHHLRLKPNVPAGMSVLRICAIADGLRNAGRDVDEPVVVRRAGEDDWLVVEGRHRFVAAYVAGCVDLLCVEDGAGP